MNKSRIGVNL